MLPSAKNSNDCIIRSTWALLLSEIPIALLVRFQDVRLLP